MKDLREARKKAGMTQETLARRVGVSQKTVSAWERTPGRTPQKLALLREIAKALGLRTDFFIRRIGGNGG